ncbi:MAG: cupin domain-containing protein [Anaerolineae bacterium]|nr:cupin domain-containing protein [Anaerolineae bacterium]
MEKKVSVAEVAEKLPGPFKHLVMGQVDDYCAYLTRIEGTYLYHQHPKDEMYFVLEGEITIEYDDGATTALGAGESLVVRAGEKHRSCAESSSLVLMFKARDLFAE